MDILKHPTPKEVKDTRTSIDLSQAQAGNLLHVSERHFSRWEHGTAKMPLAYWELFMVKVRVLKAKRDARPMA
jgi:DNA-binding transcriptional regulator YiaG|tara:strand:+ start:642 stop:860 length:219 start_codon:yes stop_codon:yes gene_type:complete